MPLKRIDRQGAGIPGQEDPVAPISDVGVMRPMKTNISQMIACRKRCHHRTQIEHPIGNMKYETRVRTPEVLQINFNRFLCEQVEGDGVAAKSIHKQNVEFLRT